ncbi:pyridoxal phosphate-dependent aminotransferase [Sphingomonas sp. ERG5]|uniref:pyridoxal phosphate-dependent aminotransferase n=1 Tax=Sphingomonas sp. ERG5 TaxID=1381597 RepID=UPI000691B332|nr:histidinol-phosphate transaminase [Sphingomonas sp. ERG5]
MTLDLANAPVLIDAPQPVPGVLKLAPYKQGKMALDGVDQPLKLSSNESMNGPSPRAIAAYRALADAGLQLYPDGSQRALRQAIADEFDLDADRILCGNGSDELIQLLMRAYLAPGDDVVLSQYSFGMAIVHATSIGANPIIAEEPRLRPDADIILARITDRTRMVVLASPNNPVGQYIPRTELRRLRAELPRDVILLIDSAYADYVTEADYEPGSSLVEGGDNCVMTRTFSKLYGLAGLRIGWMYAPFTMIDAVQRIRTPFNANAAALAAAEAAVRDHAYAAQVRASNNSERARIAAAVTALGFEFIPSFANFYLIRFAPSGRTAAAAGAWLEANGIIPRPVNAGGPEQCLRISVGLPEHNDQVIAALTTFARS